MNDKDITPPLIVTDNTLVSPHAMSLMETALGLPLATRRASCVQIAETANDDGLVFNGPSGDPSTAFLVNSDHSAPIGLWTAQVPHVSGAVNTPQIRPSVIRSVTVDMVDLVGILSCHPLPNDPVLISSAVVDATNEVSGPIDAGERGPASVDAVPNAAGVQRRALSVLKIPGFERIPDQTASFRAVSEQLAKPLHTRQGRGSHSAVSLRSWSGPRGVSRTVAGRSFPSRINVCSQGKGSK